MTPCAFASSPTLDDGTFPTLDDGTSTYSAATVLSSNTLATRPFDFERKIDAKNRAIEIIGALIPIQVSQVTDGWSTGSASEGSRMTKTKTKAALIAANQAASALAAAVPSAKNRRAAVEASAALSAWIAENDPPKRRGYASRAGKRQAAERRSQASVRGKS